MSLCQPGQNVLPERNLEQKTFRTIPSPPTAPTTGSGSRYFLKGDIIRQTQVGTKYTFCKYF